MVQLYGRSGSEFLVNTVTEDIQAPVMIARLASGGFVLVWTDHSGIGGDSYDRGVKAQIYDSAGARVGGEILVNSSTASWETAEGVAALPNGGFIVTYDVGQVAVQMFDAAGARIGGEILVSTYDPNLSAGLQSSGNSEVAVLASGMIVVTWDRRVRNELDVYAQILTPEGVKSGAEFRVHGHTYLDQQKSSITALASGGFIVTWEDDVEQGGGLRGGAFNANGTPASHSFQITTIVEGSQEDVAITALPGGGFVAVWEDHSVAGGDGSGSSIKGQIFTDVGVKIGPEFLVNTFTRGGQYSPSVDELPGGGFVVTWMDGSQGGGDTSSSAIMAQVFDSAGAKVGTQFLVNSETRGLQDMPVVTGLASGGFAIAWTDGSGDSDIKAQIFAPVTGGPTDIAVSAAVRETSMTNYAAAILSHNGGVNGVSTYTLLSDSTGGGFRIEGDRLVVADNRRLDHETAPIASLTVRVTDANGDSYEELLSVAIADAAIEDRYSAGPEFSAYISTNGGLRKGAMGALASGGYVMAWMDPGPDRGGGAVRAQMFGPDGAKVGVELAVNIATDGYQASPGTAGLASGGFVVVWGDSSLTGGDSNGSSVKGQRFDSAGTKVGGEFLVNTITAGSQSAPAVAALSSGGFVVTWTDLSNSSADDFSSGDIRAQIYDAAGAKAGGEFLVNSTTFSGQTAPAVASLPGGSFIVAWIDNETSAVVAQRFDPAGNKVGGEIQVGTSSFYFGTPAIAALASGGFVVSWTGAGSAPDDSNYISVQGQIFDSAGSKSGAVFFVNTEIQSESAPTVSGLPWGGFVISWQDDSHGTWPDNGYSVRGQLFDGAGGRIGDDFIVSVGTEGNQYAPVSTVLASGDFVVGWTDFGTVGAVKGRVFSLTGADNGGDDVLTGDAGDNLIHGGAGNDRIDGGEGNDSLRGDAGDDVLIGGAGDDDYAGGDGTDTLDFSGEAGSVSVNFSSNSGLFSNSPLATRPLNPGEAFDSFGNYEAVSGIENLILTSGDDFVLGSDSANRIEAGAGDDILLGEGGNDLLLGAAGFDFLSGGTGDDRIEGGGDDDDIEGGDGDDRLDGGSGSDTAIYSTAGAGVTVTLGLPGDAQNTGGAGVDTLIDIENLTGSEFGDILIGNDLPNVLHGLGGDDTMRGGDGDDTYFVTNAGDSVEELAGQGVDTVRTWLTVYSLVGLANVENLSAAGPTAARDFRGNAANNVIAGGSRNDVLRLYDGGSDTANGGGGDDILFFIGTLDSSDVVNGGTGVDTLVLQGPYGFLTLTANVTQIENVSILGGGNTAFGEPGTNRYDYVLTTVDSNFAAGVQARINAAALLEGEDFTFDGTAETDAKYVVYGGKGKDTLTGGLGNDIFFYAEERFASGDTVNGGAGYDGMFLRGNYTIDFNAPGYTGLFTNIENLTLTSATDERYARGGGSEFDYNLTLSDAIVGAGQQLTISGTILMASESMILDASQETDGSLRLFGGKADDTLKGGGQADLIHGNLGADTLAGNGGADVFRFQETAESNSATMDRILDFTPGTDRIELDRIDANTLTAGDQAFSWIGSSAFSGVAGQLRAYEQGGTWFVEGDVNGDSVADLVIALTLQGPTPLSAADFLP